VSALSSPQWRCTCGAAVWGTGQVCRWCQEDQAPVRSLPSQRIPYVLTDKALEKGKLK
jgi:hypothetical protein